eukprot:PLAT10585.2.p3 GENE.PLAT10585.2~~PLAT10585.2.p3  ORF type:complete len:137 (+),score=39.08 PLAT10585.2:312-722(+)
MEAVEAHMAAQRFDEAAALLAEVINRFPSFTLAWYRLALCKAAVRGPAALKDITPLLRCAMTLEPDNKAMRGGVDLLLRLATGVSVPEEMWKASHPKSDGDVLALARLVMERPQFKRKLMEAAALSRAKPGRSGKR